MGQTQDNIVPDSAPAGDADLADQIESLLGDIESTQHTIAQTVGDQPPPTTPSDQSLGDDGVASHSPPGDVAPEAPGADPVPAQAALNAESEAQSAIDQAQQSLSDLSGAVDELLSPQAQDPTASAAPDVPPSSAPSPESVVSPPTNADNIHSLDEELAKLTDELLADPNASVPAQPADALPEPVPAPTPPETTAPAESTPPPAPPEAKPAEPKAQDPARAEPKPAAKPAAKSTANPSDQPAAPAKPGLWQTLSPKLLRVVSFASLPLQGRPEGLRGALGVMAAGTAFMGAALWIIVLTRSQPLDEAHSGSFDFEHASLPEIPSPNDKDAHAKDPHAEPAKDAHAKDAHGEAKKDDHADAKKDDHGKDAHAEKKPPPKKTTKSKSSGKKGKDAKPPPKKDDAHGGGH